jgi:spore maturation protein CgeB
VDYLRRPQIAAFDLYLSWTGGDSLRELEQDWGARLARPLYGCVDPDRYYPAPARDDYRCDLSYMGTYAADRQEKLDRLFLEPSRRRRDRRFVLAGSLYPWEWQWGENVVRFDHVFPTEHPAFYSSARATLNITREDMARVGYCPSPRLFEAAACGSLIVSDTWPGLEMFFAAGEELLPATTAEDVMRALELSDDARSRIARRARERTLDENTGDRRAEQLLKCIEEASGRVEAQAATREAA